MAAVERIVVEHADVEGPILKVLGRYEFYPGRQRVVYLGTRIDVSCWLRTREAAPSSMLRGLRLRDQPFGAPWRVSWSQKTRGTC